MAKQRNPNRERAAEIYRQHDGNITNRKIAEMLSEDEKVIAVWKQRDKEVWGLDVVQQKTPKPPKVVQQGKRHMPKHERPEAPEPSEGLSEKEQIFVIEYMRDFNATRAAIVAGYSKRSAYTEGWRMLKKADIKAELKRMQAEMAGAVWLDVKRVIEEYMKIAFADITDIAKFDAFTVQLRDHKTVDGAVISEVKQGKEGVSIKLHDKIRALKELEKYLGYLTEEDKLRIAKLRAEVNALEGPKDDGQDDGFIEALQGKASEVWGDGEQDNEEEQPDIPLAAVQR
jgi:phage terminase small subunit